MPVVFAHPESQMGGGRWVSVTSHLLVYLYLFSSSMKDKGNKLMLTLKETFIQRHLQNMMFYTPFEKRWVCSNGSTIIKWYDKQLNNIHEGALETLGPCRTQGKRLCSCREWYVCGKGNPFHIPDHKRLFHLDILIYFIDLDPLHSIAKCWRLASSLQRL